MPGSSERRKDPRFRAHFDTLVSNGRKEGTGVLADISYSGARLDDASLIPEEGTEVRLYVFILPINPFELKGSVVRTGDRSFAVHYDVDDPEVRRLVDDVAAIVSAVG